MDKFSPLPSSYEAPEVKLEIHLKPYDKTPTAKTPALTGWVKFSKLQLEAIRQIIQQTDGQSINLRVALWDSSDGRSVDGVIEYREYTKLADPTPIHSPSSPSHWY